MKGDIDGAMEKLNELWEQGYSAIDIVVTIFRVVKTFDECVRILFLTSLHICNTQQNARIYKTGIHQGFSMFPSV